MPLTLLLEWMAKLEDMSSLEGPKAYSQGYVDGCVMPSDIVSQQGIEFIDAGDPGRVQGIEEAGTECPEIALHFSLVM